MYYIWFSQQARISGLSEESLQYLKALLRQVYRKSPRRAQILMEVANG